MKKTRRLVDAVYGIGYDDVGFRTIKVGGEDMNNSRPPTQGMIDKKDWAATIEDEALCFMQQHNIRRMRLDDEAGRKAQFAVLRTDGANLERASSNM